MEENENDMSLFGQEFELNYDYNAEDIQDEDEDLDPEDEKNIKPVDENTEDDDTQESVDGEDEEDDEGDSDDDDSSPNLYSSFSDVLKEQGIIPSLESSKDIKTVDDLAEAINKEISLQAELRASEKLDSLDLDKIGASRKAVLELDSIDEQYLKDNLDVAKELILKDYINQGLPEDRAKRYLRKAIDLGDDAIIAEALESKESLKEFEKRQEQAEIENTQKRIAEEARQQEEINTTIKNFVFNSKEVIQGIPNTKALQQKVYKSMTEVVSKNAETGEMMNKFMSDRSKNPIEFDTKMYYLYELTNGFQNLSNIKQSVTSKAVKNLESTLRKTKFEDNGTPSYLQDPESYGGIGSELVF